MLRKFVIVLLMVVALCAGTAWYFQDLDRTIYRIVGPVPAPWPLDPPLKDDFGDHREDGPKTIEFFELTGAQELLYSTRISRIPFIGRRVLRGFYEEKKTELNSLQKLRIGSMLLRMGDPYLVPELLSFDSPVKAERLQRCMVLLNHQYYLLPHLDTLFTQAEKSTEAEILLLKIVNEAAPEEQLKALSRRIIEVRGDQKTLTEGEKAQFRRIIEPYLAQSPKKK